MKPLCFLLSTFVLVLCACGDNEKKGAIVSDELAEKLFLRGDSLFEANDYIQAIEQYRQSLQLYEQKQDTTGMSDCYFQMSTAYHRIGAFNLSIDMVKKCLYLDSLTNNTENLSSSYNTLAALCLSAKDLKSAKKFIDKAIELEQQTKNQENMSSRYGLAAEIYTKAADPKEGLSFGQRAFELDSIRSDTANMGKRLSQIGDAFAALNQFPEAEQAYLDAAKLLSHTSLMNSICINYKQLGHLYDKTNRRQQALYYYEKSVEVARQYGLNYLLESDLSRMAELYGDTDRQKGYLIAREALQLKDSIYNEKIQMATQEFSARYDLVTKENKIAEQESRIHSQRAWLIAFNVFFLLLILAVAAYFYIRYIKREKQRLNVKYYHALTRDFNADNNDVSHISIGDDVISTTEADRQFILKVDDVIERHLDNSSLSSIRLSQELCLSQRQFNRKMKAITGIDTGTYIRDRRIMKAKQLLRDSALTIGEIQAVCGFESPSYFSKVFKDVEGISPSEFRKTKNN